MKFLKEVGVDIVNIVDFLMVRVRIFLIVFVYIFKEELGMELILYFICRDRNFIFL